MNAIITKAIKSTYIVYRPKVTTIMTGHENIRSYLHGLKIMGSPECPYKHGTQTADRLIFQCNGLKNEREKPKTSVMYLE
jgi:hypothetical protein